MLCGAQGSWGAPDATGVGAPTPPHEVVESEAQERAVGDGAGPWAAGAGVGCWVLRVVWACARAFPGDLCALVPV